MVFAKRHDYGQAHARSRILLLDRRRGTFRNRDHFRVDRLVLHPYERLWIRWNDKINQIAYLPFRRPTIFRYAAKKKCFIN